VLIRTLELREERHDPAGLIRGWRLARRGTSQGSTSLLEVKMDWEQGRLTVFLTCGYEP